MGILLVFSLYLYHIIIRFEKVHDFFAISYLHIFSQMKVGKTEKTVFGEHSTGIVFDPWTMIFSSHSVDS